MKKSNLLKKTVIALIVFTVIAFAAWAALFVVVCVSTKGFNFPLAHFTQLFRIFAFPPQYIPLSITTYVLIGLAFLATIVGIVISIVKRRGLIVFPMFMLVVSTFATVEAVANLSRYSVDNVFDMTGYLGLIKNPSLSVVIVAICVLATAFLSISLAWITYFFALIHACLYPNKPVVEEPEKIQDMVIDAEENPNFEDEPTPEEDINGQDLRSMIRDVIREEMGGGQNQCGNTVTGATFAAPLVVQYFNGSNPVEEKHEEPKQEEPTAEEVVVEPIPFEDEKPAPVVKEVSLGTNAIEIDLAKDRVANLVAEVKGENDPDQAVTWASNDDSIVVVNSNGVVVGIKVGSASVTATSKQDETKFAVCTVTVIETKEEPAPAPVQEPVKEPEPEPEPQPEPEPEPVVEEPAPAPVVVEEPAPLPAPAPVVEEKKPIIRIPFEERITTADKEMKDNYNELKNEIMSYGVKSRVSNSGDTFRLHRKTYVKLTIAGKSLKLYFALNPDDYKDSTLPIQDASGKGIYEEIPLVFKVKSGLSMRRCKQLIADVMEKDNLVQGEIGKVNWVKEIAAEMKERKKAEKEEAE